MADICTQGVDTGFVGLGYAKVAFLGLVQGITELLPISSTAHMRIVPAVLGWQDPGSAFSAAMQLAALAAVISRCAPVGDFYSVEIASAKIVLAFHMGVDPATGYEDLVSTRSFEIPACGGFMLHIDNDEIRSLYDVPSEIDTFTDSVDLIAKIRYWLAHPEERVAVAARGHARAVPAYGYIQRGRELAALIERKLGLTVT